LQVLPTSNPRASDLKDNMPYVLQTEMHEVNATKRKVGMYSSKSNYKSKEFFGKILKFATGSKYTSTSTLTRQHGSSGKIRKDVFTGKITAYFSSIVKHQNKIAK
jgi:hypothetical protein